VIVIDTHVLFWIAAHPDKISTTARQAIDTADNLAVAAITWYELALLIERGRLDVRGDKTAALQQLATLVTTIGLDVSIASAASDLEAYPGFPRDPADRMIFATAQQRKLRLVTADGRLRDFSAQTCVW